MYPRCCAISRDYIKKNLRLLQWFDNSNTHYVIALLFDLRYTRLIHFVEYANLVGNEDISHIMNIVRTYLDFLMQCLQSLHSSILDHNAYENPRDQKVVDAFDFFDVTHSETSYFYFHYA